MDKYRRWHRTAAWLLAAAMTAGGGGIQARAEEASAGAGAGTEAVQVTETVRETEAVRVTEAAAGVPTETPAETRPEETTAAETKPDQEEKPEVQNLTVSSYELYAAGAGKEPQVTVRKGRQVRMLVYVKASGIRTGDVKKSDISVTKLGDSFKSTGTPKIKVISEKEDKLEFTVTFSNLTYRGKGNSLKFRTSFKKTDIPSEVLETVITECEEYGQGGNSDSGTTTGQPVMKVRRITPQAPVTAGDHFTLELELENTSNYSDIEDLVVSVSPGGSVFIGEDTNSRVISRIETKRTVSVKLGMIAGQEITGPTQAIDLELKYNYYSDGNLVPGTSAQKVLIPVQGKSVSGQPVIHVERSGAAAAVQAGQAFAVPVKLTNTSTDKDIRNLSVVFESNEHISLMENTDTKLLGELKAGQTAEITVHLKAGAELPPAASQLLGVTMRFDYDSDKGPVQGTCSEKIVIPTDGKTKEPGGMAPNIIVANYTYGEKVTAGQVFDLELEFMNTSQTASVDNVVLSLDTGEGISINSSSNTFYIPALGPGERTKKTVKVQALFQSKLQSPRINIACKYEYVDRKERKQSSSSETIAIPVYQPDRFQVKNPVYTDTVRQGEEATISLPYVNKGRGQVFNVEARLEGEIEALERDLTLGNFEAGKSGTIDFVVTPKNEGPFKGQVVVSYEDEAMEIKTLAVDVAFEVAAAAQEHENVSEPEEIGDRGGRKYLWIFAAAAGISLLTAVFRILKKKREKKRSSGESDDWEEEE